MVYRDDEDYEEEDPGAPPHPTDSPVGPAPTGPAPAPTASGGGGGGGGGSPDLGPQYNYPGLPGFVPPVFARPTMETALQEPGYEFRLGAGQQALERSAAARGVLRTGGTLQNILEYGQKFGQQEYSNVFNRALQEYDRTYQGAKDKYAPLLAQWQTKAQGEHQRALALYQNQNRGGGGGYGIPGDILGPPPAPPGEEDWARSMGMSGPAAAPALYAPADSGQSFAPSDDDERFRRY